MLWRAYYRRYGINKIEVWRLRLNRLNEYCYQLLQYKYGYIVIMCDNLDGGGKERCGLEGQGLNTGSEVSTRD